MSEDRKWKRGDIGPDGRVFWGYDKKCKNGESWLTKDSFAKRKYSNKLYQDAFNRSAKHKARKKSTEYKAYQMNVYKTPKYKAYNREASRASGIKKTFRNRDGSSLGAFLNTCGSNYHLSRTLSAIMDLKVPDGKTLAEYIRDLSGYEMSVCEEIANLCKGEFPDA